MPDFGVDMITHAEGTQALSIKTAPLAMLAASESPSRTPIVLSFLCHDRAGNLSRSVFIPSLFRRSWFLLYILHFTAIGHYPDSKRPI